MRDIEVLIIEDKIQWQNILQETITSNGFTCKVAANYLEALQLLHTINPSVITLDLNLRPESHHEARWEGWLLAEQAQKRRIPIIIVSAYAGAERASKAFRKYNAVLLFFFDKSDFIDHQIEFESILTETIVVNKITRAKLRKLIVSFFDISELKDLAFDLGINFDNLSGDSGKDKARELILLMERKGRLDDLIMACEENRPHIVWK